MRSQKRKIRCCAVATPARRYLRLWRAEEGGSSMNKLSIFRKCLGLASDDLDLVLRIVGRLEQRVDDRFDGRGLRRGERSNLSSQVIKTGVVGNAIDKRR